MKHLASRAALAVLAFVGCTGDDDAPTDHVVAKTTQLVQYASCSQLEADLEDELIHDVWVNIDRYDPSPWGFGSPESAGEDSAGGGDSGGGRQEGQDYSGTNNQEQGVDEADLVKTDGYHIYALNGNRLHIFGVPQFGQLVPESVTPIEGHPREMLLDRDGRAVVFSYIYVANLPAEHPLRALTGWQSDDRWYWRSPLITKMTVLDLSDRTAPRLMREAFYEGWYQTARKVDSSVRVSTYSSIARWETYGWYELLRASGYNKSWTKQEMARRIRALSLSDLIPQLYVRHPSGAITTNSLSTSSCQSFYRPTDSHARGVSSIISFDLLGDQLKFDADHVISNWATFYSSRDKILLAEAAHSWWWFWWFQDDPDHLNLHVFDISQPGKSRYVGSGRVEGQINDQFALDEENGVFRVASTTNLFRWWRNSDDEIPPIENHVWTLELQGNKLETLGHIGGIALGERITASRFLGDKGYLVTFERVDPLWTLDLSNKYEPRLVGELEIPGFSTYLHPIGTDKLLTIGVGGDENGANWKTTISTFDVSNFAQPAQTSVLPIEADNSWGWSEALSEHKAFQYFAPKKLLAVPQSNYAYNSGNYRYLSTLEVIEVDENTGALSRRGAIDHSSYYDPTRYWSYLQIRRSIFMGDYLYAISDKAITVHRTADLGQVTAQTLPGYTANDWYWWW